MLLTLYSVSLFDIVVARNCKAFGDVFIVAVCGEAGQRLETGFSQGKPFVLVKRKFWVTTKPLVGLMVG